MKYKQKPVEVEAFQVTRDIEISAPSWFGKEVNEERAYIDKILDDGSMRVYGCTIQTPTGKAKAKIGDYIIREPSGTLCIRKKSVFRELYGAS